MKNKKVMTIILISFLLLTGLGLAGGYFDDIVSLCRSFIYCNAAELPVKK